VTKGAAQINAARVKEDERYDGKYVLRTSTDLPAWEVAEAYKQLSWIERLWRELKHVMEVRPIYHHQKKENVKGHIFASFLALYLSARLRRRLEEMRQKEHPEEASPSRQGGMVPVRLPIPWEKLLEDLSQVRAITVCMDNQRDLMRTELKGYTSEVFRAVGVRPPPLAQPLKS
jgi:hypothetical protein